MCSTISMPADYEMLVSHSPPVFSHSPPSYYTEYSPYRLPYDHAYNRAAVSRGLCRVSPPRVTAAPNSASATLAATPSNNSSSCGGAQPSPRRPCLVLRPDDTATPIFSDPTSPTRLKKRVVFADDRGMSLTQVRVMSEPSSVPPLWTTKFLAQVTKGLSAEVAPEPWEVAFAQPASDYVDFRRRLDHDNVSLENVIVRETEECVVGTIKVRNLNFHKEVIVRSSADDWKTHEDTFCKFVNNNSQTGSGHYVLYDTFSFRLTLPPRSRRIEFCVCFRCDGKEYWDNNAGKNYVLLKKLPEVPKSDLEEDLPEKPSTEEPDILTSGRCTDALHAKISSWSEFASWNHLENTGPYW